MNDEQIAKMAKWKLLGMNSCAKCKFMYFQDVGYSNYTVEDTEVICSLDRNPNLPSALPHDWDHHDGFDNWPKTNKSRCERYEESSDQIHMDVDHEHHLEHDDPEVREAVSQSSGREVKSPDER